MAEAVARNDINGLQRLVNSSSDRISFVGVKATGTSADSNPLWRQFSRVKVDGVVCQAVRCNKCDIVIGHRTGTAYDGSQGRSSGTTGLKRHICPKNISQQCTITSMLMKAVPEGAVRSEKRTVAGVLSDVCAEDMRPFSFVEGKHN